MKNFTGGNHQADDFDLFRQQVQDAMPLTNSPVIAPERPKPSPFPRPPHITPPDEMMPLAPVPATIHTHDYLLFCRPCEKSGDDLLTDAHNLHDLSSLLVTAGARSGKHLERAAYIQARDVRDAQKELTAACAELNGMNFNAQQSFNELLKRIKKLWCNTQWQLGAIKRKLANF